MYQLHAYIQGEKEDRVVCCGDNYATYFEAIAARNRIVEKYGYKHLRITKSR